jgi:transposase-like protein
MKRIIDSGLRYVFKGLQGRSMIKTYDKDFKLKIAKDIKNGTKTVTEIADAFGISRPIVSRWLA